MPVRLILQCFLYAEKLSFYLLIAAGHYIFPALVFPGILCSVLDAPCYTLTSNLHKLHHNSSILKQLLPAKGFLFLLKLYQALFFVRFLRRFEESGKFGLHFSVRYSFPVTGKEAKTAFFLLTL